MQKVYGSKCLSRPTIYEWIKLFKEGREDLNDEERSGRLRSGLNEENFEIVGEFIKKAPKSSLQRTKRTLLCLSWCYEALAGTYSSCAARISFKRKLTLIAR